MEKTVKKPIPARRAGVNKVGDRNPENWARLVVREVKRSLLGDAFAAAPPLEVKKVLFSLAMSCRARFGGARKLSFVDMKRALPGEDAAEGMCGKLDASLYGARDAARKWGGKYAEVLSELEFVVGKSSPRLFRNEKRDLRSAIHGDDVTTVGDDEKLGAFGGKLARTGVWWETGSECPSASGP